jgi:hypothetical protein
MKLNCQCDICDEASGMENLNAAELLRARQEWSAFWRGVFLAALIGGILIVTCMVIIYLQYAQKN